MKRLMTAGLVLGFFLAAPSAPAQAQSKSRKLFTILDEVSDGTKSRSEGLEALKALGDAEALAKLARKGRPIRKGLGVGKEVFELVDGLGRTTDLYVIVPKKRPAKGYGLLILLHGLGGQGQQLIPAYEKFAKKNGLVIAAPSAKRLPGAGQKGPGGVKAQANEDTRGLEVLQHWWAYRKYGFPMQALSFLRRRLKLDNDRILLSGYSMGGFGTWNVGLRFHDRFAALVPLAGSISRQENFLGVDQRSRKLLDNALRQPIFFAHGARDRVVRPDADRRSRDALEAMGAPFVYVEDPKGEHILRQYYGDSKDRKRLDSWMGKQRRQPFPKHIQHRALGAYMGRAYWAQILDLNGEDALVKAEAVDRTHIKLELDNVERLRLELPPALFDGDKTIVVTVGEQEVFKGVAEASHEALLDSWLGREDASLVAARAITVEIL